MNFSSYFLTLALGAATLSSCQQKQGTDPAPATGQMSIDLEHMVDTKALKLNSSTTAFDYATPSNEAFNITTFRYYLSNIKLQRADGTEYIQPDSYYLVDEAKPASKTLVLKDVPVGDYTGLSFMVGVDAAHNTAGAQQGALSPSDMFWGWNQGYIFLKLDGYSPAAPDNHSLTFDIGGFTEPYNALRTVAPPLPTGVKMLIRADHSPEVHMKVDAMRVFVGPTTVRFGSFTVPPGPSANAVLVSKNYAAGMFEVEHVHAN